VSKRHVVILGAGFAGLELAARLSDSLAEVRVTLIDQNDAFFFGYSKLDVLFGGIREAAEIRVIGPMAAPVPITKQLSQSILDALGERGIEYVSNQHITELDTLSKEVRLADGGRVPHDLFIGIPVHRVPEVVEASGLAVDGWIPVDHTNLATRFTDVYASATLQARRSRRWACSRSLPPRSSQALAADKEAFGATRRERWFGRPA
jgi:NADH dehydrogenase FAD-containing subunit